MVHGSTHDARRPSARQARPGSQVSTRAPETSSEEVALELRDPVCGPEIPSPSILCNLLRQCRYRRSETRATTRHSTALCLSPQTGERVASAVLTYKTCHTMGPNPACCRATPELTCKASLMQKENSKSCSCRVRRMHTEPAPSLSCTEPGPGTGKTSALGSKKRSMRQIENLGIQKPDSKEIASSATRGPGHQPAPSAITSRGRGATSRSRGARGWP